MIKEYHLLTNNLNSSKIENTFRRQEVRGTGLKMDLQKIVEFNRKVEDWQKWKNRMECALDG
eukprot:3171200-Ditylum_brightwellii.AAC.1